MAAPEGERKKLLRRPLALAAVAGGVLAILLVLGLILQIASSRGGGEDAIREFDVQRSLSDAPKGQPTEVWRVRAEDGSVFNVGDLLFAVESDAGGGRLNRLNPRSGQSLWQANLDASPSLGLEVAGVLVVSGGGAGGAAEGTITYGFDPKSGQQRWRVPGFLRSAGRRHVVLSDEGSISVVDARSGTTKMRVSEDGLTNAAISPDDQTVYVGDDRSVVARKLDGSVRWTVAASAQRIVVAGGMVVVADEDGDRVRIRGLSASDGKERWSQPADSSASIVSTFDGRLLSISERRAEVLDPAKGTSVASLGTRATDGALLQMGSKELFVGRRSRPGSGSRGEDVEVVDLAKPGALAWSAPRSGCVTAGRGVVIVGNIVRDDGRITAHRARDGRQLWEVTVRDGGSGCAVAGGTLAVAAGGDVVGFR